MARTTFVELAPGQDVLFYKPLSVGDRFTFARLNKKTKFFSRKKKKGISQRSLLPQIAEIWKTFTPEQKQAWTNAGAQVNLDGWKLFVQDQSARIINEIAGSAAPSLLHQSWVGYLSVEAPATAIKISQLHPRAYWISRKVAGKKSMYEPVLVTEDFALPLTITINYRSSLTVSGGENYARFYARVWSSYQGVDRYTDLIVPFDYVSGWSQASAVLSSVIGHIIGYSLFLELKGVQGWVECDNIKAEHSGQNWVRDTQCLDLNEAFTRAFYQIPKHWIGISMPAGAEFGSLYPADS